jgi:hypothetical protein
MKNIIMAVGVFFTVITVNVSGDRILDCVHHCKKECNVIMPMGACFDECVDKCRSDRKERRQ